MLTEDRPKAFLTKMQSLQSYTLFKWSSLPGCPLWCISFSELEMSKPRIWKLLNPKRGDMSLETKMKPYAEVFSAVVLIKAIPASIGGLDSSSYPLAMVSDTSVLTGWRDGSSWKRYSNSLVWNFQMMPWKARLENLWLLQPVKVHSGSFHAVLAYMRHTMKLQFFVGWAISKPCRSALLLAPMNV